jgi:hypothetical protein
MIRHDSPAVVVHALPGRVGTPLAELLESFDPEPIRGHVDGELEAVDLGAILPFGFLHLAEWRRS